MQRFFFFYFAILCAAGKFLKFLSCPSVMAVISDTHAHSELHTSDLLSTQASMMSRKQKRMVWKKKGGNKYSNFSRHALTIFSVTYEGKAPRVLGFFVAVGHLNLNEFFIFL